MEPEVPTKKLVEGFNRFRERYYKDGNGLMDKLAKDGARADFFIVNCIDPRNGADLVFDAEPGQQFIHSRMGAIVPPYDPNKQPELNASLSYACDTMKVKHLIIVGHTQCGGVAALVSGTPDRYIEAWVKTAQEAERIAAKKVGTADSSALHRETERQVVIMSYNNILEYPMVKKAMQEGRLTVSGWLFDMEKGTLNEYQPETGTFKQLSASTKPSEKKPAPPFRPTPPKIAA